MPKPKLFIGSSKEAVPVARKVQRELADSFDVTPWYRSFELSKTNVENLDRLSAKFDGGIFVFGYEDREKFRGKSLRVTRDNIVFEFGLFMGRLGRSRSVVLTDKSIPKSKLPADLLGMHVASFDGSGSDRDSSLAAACTDIREHFERTFEVASRERSDLTPLRAQLELTTRAACLPSLPMRTDIRVFLFRVEGEELVCRQSWSDSETREDVGVLTFHPKRHKDVSVVKAWRTRKPQADTLRPAPQKKLAKDTGVDPQLRFILAAPVFVDRKVWGVVDFDTSSAMGTKVLSSKAAQTVAVYLAREIGKAVATRTVSSAG
jgi:CAP12/Pycsar effector protein, TIR domain